MVDMRYPLQPTCNYLCQGVPKSSRLVHTKSQLALAQCNLPSVEEHPGQDFLPAIECPIMHRHIRVQRSAEHTRVLDTYQSSDAPYQFLVEIGIAPIALVTIRSVRRRLGQLPHEHGGSPYAQYARTVSVAMLTDVLRRNADSHRMPMSEHAKSERHGWSDGWDNIGKIRYLITHRAVCPTHLVAPTASNLIVAVLCFRLGFRKPESV